ncbi:MAG: hypothetical protein IPG59_12880 [Candidatus Melainabacteria bacterium]|nr:MAG: hypothetical protein IPG59_12880 [Candidatus Melainabacteria bacterium]
MADKPTPLENYFEQLLTSQISLFEQVLLRASANDDHWLKRIETFKRLGMLEFLVPSKFKAPKIEIDQDRMEHDGRYRQTVSNKLKRRRPGKWTRHIITINQDELDDETYRKDISKVLAMKFLALVIPTGDTTNESSAVILPLLRMNADQLELVLDSIPLNKIDAPAISRAIIEKMAHEAIENNPKFQQICRDISTAAQAALAEFRVHAAEIRAKALDDFEKSSREILAEVCKFADHSITGVMSVLESLETHFIDVDLSELNLPELDISHWDTTGRIMQTYRSRTDLVRLSIPASSLKRNRKKK